MFSRATRRLSTALVVVLSLLFSQLALANYVCPPAVPVSEPVAMEMAPGEPCEGMGMASGKAMDQTHAVLCHQHCVNAPQSFDPVQVPTISLPAVVQVLVVPLLLDDGDGKSLAFVQGEPERPPPDPLFLSTLRLRV
jgi:hypothetical protein